MLRLIELLQHKNHYLEKFYSLSEAEIARLADGNFDNIESFYEEREKILDMIRYVDAEIEIEQPTALEASGDEQKREVRDSLRAKDQYVVNILDQDLKILEYIEAMKSNIIKELQEIQNTKRVMKGYKSPTFQRRVDEEA